MLLIGFSRSEAAAAATLSALLGPPSLGQGGSNPLSIPPGNPLDWQASYRSDEGREWMLSLVPGVYYGQRWTKDRLTLGLGGGLLVGANGLGLGFYQSLGFATPAFWKRYHFEAEYRQLIGYTNIGLEFPYTLRMGLSYDL